MKGISGLILIALLGTSVLGLPEGRLRRSYDNVHGGQGSYGIGSDERDASVDERAPCALLDNSGSRENMYDLDERPSHEHRRGFSVKAAAAASSSSYT